MASVIERDAVVRRLASHLCLDDAPAVSDVPSLAIISECLRDSLLKLSAKAGETASQPVHVLSLLGAVRLRLQTIWPSLSGTAESLATTQEHQDRDLVRRALDDLERVTDAAHVGGGYWLPTPVRLVDTGESERAEKDVLVLGTASTRSLRLFWHPKVRRRNVVRSISQEDLPSEIRENDAVWQPLDEWLRVPPEALSAWADRELERARKSLGLGSEDLVDFEYYDPLIAPKRPQRYRWAPGTAGNRAPTDLVLCRQRYGFSNYAARYWLGSLKAVSGGLRIAYEANVELSDVPRLMYAIDARTRCQTRAIVEDAGSDLGITLFNRLPAPEWRLLLAVARPDLTDEGYVRRYLVPRSLAPTIFATLGALQIILATRS